MSRQLEADVKEIKERVIRTESRVVQLGDHVGANLRAKLRIHRVRDANGNQHVEVDSYDVSISRILSDLEEAGWSGDVGVEVHGKRVATLHVGSHRSGKSASDRVIATSSSGLPCGGSSPCST